MPNLVTSTSNGIGIHRGPKNGCTRGQARALGEGCLTYLKTRPSPRAESSTCWTNRTKQCQYTYMDLLEKLGPLHDAFQGYPKWHKLIGYLWLPKFLLLVVININHGPILHCYQVNWGDFDRKYDFFLHLVFVKKIMFG